MRKRILLPALAILLAACGEEEPPRPYTVQGKYGPLHFVLVAPSTPTAPQALGAIAREVCGAEQICNVKIWTDPSRVAMAMPMTDREAGAIQAAYLINRSTGDDRFLCHPFGGAGQRCA